MAFHSYAKHRIKGAILDSLRQLDWASRDLRKRQKQVESVDARAGLKLGRTPLDSEIADELGVSPDRWHRIQMELRTVGTGLGHAAPRSGARPPLEFPATPEFQPDRMCEHQPAPAHAGARHAELCPKRYQKVVFLYYTNDMTMKEIGDVMGVNESRVSQIHKTRFKKMAGVLQSEGIHSADAF